MCVHVVRGKLYATSIRTKSIVMLPLLLQHVAELNPDLHVIRIGFEMSTVSIDRDGPPPQVASSIPDIAQAFPL